MRKFIKKHPTTALLLALYACGLVVFLAVHGIGFAANRAARAKGEISQSVLTVDDFAVNADIEVQEDGSLLTLGGDPQLLLKDAARRVDNVVLELEYTQPPLLVNVFWAKEGQDYSPRNMAYGQSGQARVFNLPAGGGQSLRIDPGTAIGNRITVKSITVNAERPFLSFFAPSAGEAALYVALPALLACVATIVVQSGLLALLKKRGKAGDAL